MINPQAHLLFIESELFQNHEMSHHDTDMRSSEDSPPRTCPVMTAGDQ